jgi:thiol-disulfide isomerase/thioredoxin
MIRMRLVTTMTLLVGVLLAFMLSPCACLAGKESKAPDFTLANLLAGGPVIVDFWATWCKPCIKGFPGLQELFEKYKDRGLSVVAVSVDSPKSRSRVGPFIRSKKYSFEVLLDTQGRVAKKYNAVTIPRAVLISPGGEIACATVGYRPSNHEQMEKSLILLLPEKEDKGGEVIE